MAGLAGEQNPFLRYRERLDAYEVVRTGAMTDEQFVDIVAGIDAKVAATWGHGFQVSPFIDGAALASASGIEASLSIKVEAGGVGGSHKSRHLMGVAITNALAEVRRRGRSCLLARPAARCLCADLGRPGGR